MLGSKSWLGDCRETCRWRLSSGHQQWGALQSMFLKPLQDGTNTPGHLLWQKIRKWHPNKPSQAIPSHPKPSQAIHPEAVHRFKKGKHWQPLCLALFTSKQIAVAVKVVKDWFRRWLRNVGSWTFWYVTHLVLLWCKNSPWFLSFVDLMQEFIWYWFMSLIWNFWLIVNIYTSISLDIIHFFHASIGPSRGTLWALPNELQVMLELGR